MVTFTEEILMKNFIFWAVYLAGCDFLSVSILLLSVWWQIKHYSINFCNNTKRLLCELVLNIYKLFKTSFGLYVFMGYRKRSVVWNGFIMEVTKICQKLTELLQSFKKPPYNFPQQQPPHKAIPNFLLKPLKSHSTNLRLSIGII